eukprot:747559-Hanusia_phi.AAC.2
MARRGWQGGRNSVTERFAAEVKSFVRVSFNLLVFSCKLNEQKRKEANLEELFSRHFLGVEMSSHPLRRDLRLLTRARTLRSHLM